MDALKVSLEHCYGIKHLDHEFVFKKPAFAIYAPNGAMKSSFANTFDDVSQNRKSGDRIFQSRTTKREIKLEDGKELSSDQVLVIRPYDEVLGHTERTSTLLINPRLRSEYDNLNKETEDLKARLLSSIRTRSGSKRDFSKEISLAFSRKPDAFFKALMRIEGEILAQKDAPHADVQYDILFDEKVVEALGTKDLKGAIESYIRQYNDLLDKSMYFKKGIFSYYNASQIAKSLSDHGFFKASHSISLNADAPKEIKDERELEAIIKAEKDSITEDAALKKQYNNIGKVLEKNVTVRNFQNYIESHEELLPYLSDMDALREDVLKSYIFAEIDCFKELMEKYRAAEKRREEIETEASRDQTQWHDVISIFNERFFVPFRLTAKNGIQVILGQEKVLALGFIFEDGTERASVERDQLLKALSTGEKKALYILNLLFEIEVRRASGQDTLLIVDDVADSFDYKNKYAIVQYLKDLADDGHFKQIILTHNFDFFRTINGRLVPYNNCLMASKNQNGIILQQAEGIKNIFVKDWKVNFFSDNKKTIASIPFMRNLIEFTRGETDTEYMKLTSLLHWKDDSQSITRDDLYDIYDGLFGKREASTDGAKPIVDLIDEAASQCLAAGDGLNFENKIVLSMAIRLTAERFMSVKIADHSACKRIRDNQTQGLLRLYKLKVGKDHPSIKAIEKVILMTPENIHLNSFMYEPILDMSDEHLRRLFIEVRALS